MPRLLARLGILLTVSIGLTIGAGWTASAHVTVHSVEAVQGAVAEIGFRVPTESDTASTVKLSVAFPMDTPIASVSVSRHPGWTSRVTKSPVTSPVPDGHGGTLSEVIGQVEWSATGPDSAVKPGEYEEFRVSAGPLPKTDRLVFKVVQTYDSGQVVRWIEEPGAGGAEPEHPAAVLTLGSASGAADEAHAGHVPPAAAASSGGSGSSPLPWWAIAATVLGVLVALGAVLIAIRTGRRQGGDAATA